MEIIEKVVITSADIPNQKVNRTILVDDVLDDKKIRVSIQLVRSQSLFYKGADIFYKGRSLKCEFNFIGAKYRIKLNKSLVLDGQGCFSFYIDREILGSTIELKIKDFGHIITFKLHLERYNPMPTTVCWCNSERLKNTAKEAIEDRRVGSIYPNEDAFLHITTQGIFYQELAVDLVDKTSKKELCSTMVLIRKNSGVAIFSMEEIKRAYVRKRLECGNFFARVNYVENNDSDPLTLVDDGTKAVLPAKASPQMGTAKAVIGDKESKEVEDKKKTNIKLAIFFDGTSNNKENVEAREQYYKLVGEYDKSKEEKEKYKTAYVEADDKQRTQLEAYKLHRSSGSYQKDKSNVAKLWDASLNREQKPYVEGIATEDYKGDSTIGAGTGTGGTGIKAKVENGINELVTKIKHKKIVKFESITIDVYGFSRGAAAARHFIAEVTQNGVLGRTPPYGKLGVLFQENSITTKRLIIRFTGLFDTVSSHGLDFDFSDDVEALNLHKVAKSRHTVQLAAADEYRKNFALTRIGSCGGRGLELFLPGAHADIGGGYRNNDAGEKNKLIYDSSNKEFIENLRKKLIDEGWYEDEEITIEEKLHIIPNSGVGMPSYYYSYSLIGKREEVSNKYSLIPVHLMKELTDMITNDKMFNPDFDNQYNVSENPTLKTVYEQLKKFANSVRKSGATTTGLSDYQAFITDKEILNTLRNKHLHWSATPGIVNGPNIKNNNFTRIRYEDN